MGVGGTRGHIPRMQRIEIILAGLMRLMLALAVASPMIAMGDATWTQVLRLLKA